VLLIFTSCKIVQVRYTSYILHYRKIYIVEASYNFIIQSLKAKKGVTKMNMKKAKGWIILVLVLAIVLGTSIYTVYWAIKTMLLFIRELYDMARENSNTVN